MAEKKAPLSPKYEACEHRKATSPMRPDAGTQAAFKKRKPPATYLYDSSLPLTLASDDQNPARGQGEGIFLELRPRSLQSSRVLNRLFV
jgi:adenine-specific DNA-methyltransferase